MEDQYDVDGDKIDSLARLIDTTLLYDMPECETFGPIEGADLMEVIEECQRWRDSHATDKGDPLAYNPDHCAARDALTEQLRYQAKRTDLAQSLADALEWYLENDDTNMEDPNNGFYIEGNNRARAALANYRKGE